MILLLFTAGSPIPIIGGRRARMGTGAVMTKVAAPQMGRPPSMLRG